MATDALAAAVTHARALERRDDQVAAELATIGAVAGRVDAIRARAAELVTAFELIPRELDQLASRRSVAEAEATALREALVEAERALERVQVARRARVEEVYRARSEAATARETVTDADVQVGRLAEREAALRDEHASLDAEAEALVREAADVTAEVDRLQRLTPGSRRGAATSLHALDDWGGQARSALFVARGTLEQERERIVQEANALGSSILDEPLGASGVALVRRRLEERA